ncbi:MAG: bifunctional phosphopantothenoylcysteine decarboxylase/phosphopantothenate--cysteine ligase CoaBC [Fusobacterium varium]|jgi:phosphopantothenoylcysteine decarboxylase/phosphopantothenate--cysteine ligase|uniref:Coenzyme A biosynthesis bifunctional protein CoaBC n=1 Tax=Fusobacterium varium ATCC 27725 TaxID=469618 RepID=A0ABM6U6U2_FUSVA|nr:bifunctional phosphopantothenoylcysteine decarboxylase/phosphopantothenate--cysteine ligase CoaBC [Fusobacterium varium]AVQ32129.1 bifunctional phosphopantothenoylcysteine decarboxylase/phosphopantothenate--cysteine ligase CoaBC [Fusobacterium varium ATCC 27725]EES63498.1 phosphopantothenoylcysteine decarboxylase/phosphopantothenate--cysteine ligase [Fusobacterium varium ATCC 27725]MCF2673679.1 bifunctional phosphopantothenoylcysteine decarboxylase/phosphopantothenate--cysteine ligase CoaBC [
MKNILLGVTGGIAAYKSANIVSLLKKKGYNVKVIMTKNATEIITPLTLETLSRERVYVSMWDRTPHFEVEHISLAQWADVVLVAPATYNIVGKIANGIADDMLSTVISATKSPVFFALAMNVNMYENPILIENIKKLKKYNYNFIESDEGFLACNVNAKGRLKSEVEIVSILEKYFEEKEVDKYLTGKKILITAGRTEEAIDPVRYISNRSSGQMGYSLAIAARNLGAEVILVSGPTELDIPEGLTKFIKVRSAQEMYEAAVKEFETVDIAIACAAVADYKPKVYSTEKIKKKDGDMSIILDRNPDILYEMGKLKKKQFLIGFAAETENIVENALGKLKRKNLDMIVANNATNMQKKTNEILIIKNQEDIKEMPEKEKSQLAYDILKEIKL